MGTADGRMKEEILAFIAERQGRREAAKTVPPHVTTAEIRNGGFPDPYRTLNELFREGKVEWRRTINDIAFTIKKDKTTEP